MKQILFFIAIFGIMSCSNLEDQTKQVQDKNQKEIININLKLIQESKTKTLTAINQDLIKNTTIYIVNELGDVTNYYNNLNATTIKGIHIYKGMKYKIYTFININPQNLKNVKEIENYVYNLNSIEDISVNGGLIMSGKTNFITLSNNSDITITVRRCVAKLKLSCDYSQLDSNVNIAIKRVELKNVASAIKPFKEHKATEGKVLS